MGYRSDTAVQFINQAEADRFIKVYEKLLAVEKHQESSLFKFVDKTTINPFGEVTYHWDWLKFYPEFPEVKAFEDTLATDDFTCIFIRIGEDYDDIEYKEYGDIVGFSEPIYIRQEIITQY